MKPIKLISIKTLKRHAEVMKLAHRAPLYAGAEDRRQEYAKTAAEIWGEFPTRVVSDLLADINGRATTHTLHQHDVAELVKFAERRLDEAGITVANRPGTIVTLTGGVPTARAYAKRSRTAITTRVVIRRGTSAWYLDSASKFERYAGPGGDESTKFSITEAAQADIIRAAMKGFTVRQPKPAPEPAAVVA